MSYVLNFCLFTSFNGRWYVYFCIHLIKEPDTYRFTVQFTPFSNRHRGKCGRLAWKAVTTSSILRKKLPTPKVAGGIPEGLNLLWSEGTQQFIPYFWAYDNAYLPSLVTFSNRIMVVALESLPAVSSLSLLGVHLFFSWHIYLPAG